MQKRVVLAAGERIALGEMLLDDQPFFQRWLSENSELRSLIDDPHVPTMDDQLRWFERTQQPDRKMFSLLTLPAMQLIGNGGFVDIDGAHKRAALRITIGDRNALGKGYGSEAVRLLLDYGFSQMHLAHIHLKVLKTNARAIRSYEKAGFEPVNDSRDGAKIDTLVMDIDYDRFLTANGRH